MDFKNRFQLNSWVVIHILFSILVFKMIFSNKCLKQLGIVIYEHKSISKNFKYANLKFNLIPQISVLAMIKNYPCCNLFWNSYKF